MRSRVSTVPDDMTQLDVSDLEQRVAAIREQMRPLEENLASMRGERDVLLTELRRRRRLAERTSRADLKASMREGKFPSIVELIAGTDAGSLDDYTYNL